ncbi:putative MFS family arabinose efflux permease [Pseudonocardia hierapolitana]|uniref:Putative MFS family arabinose efflux permease n=1 Tax=Pseudonocardia hierapolitana TaxID=1128676 RepID=A0A561SX55_9PSEU|nr:MFS transporter [Pseudonocardia hierapolitana]TWF79448.1 putative MFS family arabinose efflux permease [Pseudonocardia hierapolitana]
MNSITRGGLHAGAFLGPFGGGLTVAMLPELGASFGVPAGTAALAVTAYMLPFAAVMVVSGTLGERWGRRRTVVTAYGVYALAALACVLAPTLPLFLAATAVLGAANAFTTPLLMAVLAATVPGDRLGRALGWFAAMQAAGSTSAPLVGGLVAEADWRLAFAGVAVVTVALALIGIPADPTAGGEPPGIRAALRPAVLRAGLAAAVGWGCLMGLGFLVALRLDEHFHAGAGPRGLVLTAAGVAGILTARLVGGAVDRTGTRGSVLAGAGLGALAIAAVGALPALWMVALAWAVGGVATQLVLVAVNALVLGAGRGAGGAVSLVQALRFGGGALSPVAFTPIYHADPMIGFLLPAVLLATVVPIVLPRRPSAVTQVGRGRSRV